MLYRVAITKVVIVEADDQHAAKRLACRHARYAIETVQVEQASLGNVPEELMDAEPYGIETRATVGQLLKAEDGQVPCELL